MSPKSPPKSLLGRSAQILGIGAKIASKEIGQRISQGLSSLSDDSKLKTQIEQAQILFKGMSQLKGAAMKAGQLLSIEARDLLPPEVAQILSKLQSEAEPMNSAYVEKILRENLKEKFLEISELNLNAFASASVGQVHRARFNSKDIVLKIQYPGILESIDSDISILKKLLTPFLLLSGKDISLDPLFEEFKIVLKTEGNYLKEGENLKDFQRRLQKILLFEFRTLFLKFQLLQF